MSEPNGTKCLTIFERPNPFEPRATRISVPCVPGKPLAQYLANRTGLITVLDGVVVPPEKHQDVIPREGQQLVLAHDLTGSGGDGKMILRSLAMLAVVAVALFLPILAPGLAAAVSATMMTAIQAGIALGGSLLINALLPPPSGQNQPSTFSWNGPQMTAQEGIPIPVQYGTLLRAGNVIESYVDETLTQSWMNVLIDFGFGPAESITDILINDNPISNYPGIWIETRMGSNEQTPLAYFTEVVTNYPQNTRLRSGDGGFTLVGTGVATQAAEFEFTFPSGLWAGPNSDGSYDSWTVWLQVSYRQVGALDWTSVLMPRTTTTLGSGSAAPYWIAVTAQWTPNANNTLYIMAVSYGAQDHKVGDSYSATVAVPVYDQFGNPTGTQNQTVTGTWQINPFGPGGAKTATPGANYVTVTDYTSVSATCTWNQTVLCRDVVRIDYLPPAQYEWRVQKIGASQNGAAPTTTTEDSTRRGEQTWFTELREITYNVLTYPNKVLLGVRALATDKLSGSNLNIQAVVKMAPTPAMGYKNEVAYDQPLAYWRMGDTTGATCADISGRGHDGLYNGPDFALGQPALIAGSPDRAVKVLGGDYITFSGIPLSGRWMFECWLELGALGGHLLSNVDNSIYIGIDATTGKLNFHFGGADHFSAVALIAAQVHHVCVGLSPGGFLFMVDETCEFQSIVPPSSWTPVQIGGSLAATIDEVALYGTVQPGRLKQHGRTGFQGIHSVLEDEDPSNPAMVAIDQLLNPLYGGQQPPSLIDAPAFQTWAAFCDELVSNGSGGEIYRHIFNGLFDQNVSLWDALTKVGQASRTVLMRTGTSYTCVCEAPAVRSQIFTMGNIKQDSFKQAWPALLDRANSFSGTFLDETNNWIRTPLRVMDEAAIAAGAPLQEAPSADLFGITNPWAAWRELQYRMLATKATLETVQIDCALEGLAARVGDVIGIQHDVPQWGYGGRILKVLAPNKIQLDQAIALLAGVEYVVMVIMPAVLRGAGVIASIVNNVVQVTTGWDGTTNVARLLDGAIDAPVTGYSVAGGVATLVLGSVAGLTVGDAVELFDTNVIETHNVTNAAPATTDTMTLDVAFSNTPPDFATYFFGQTTDIQDFRISAVGRGKDQDMSLQLMKYDPSVYGDLEPYLPPAPIIDGPNLVQNPGFESNAVGTVAGASLTVGEACSDDWTVAALTGVWQAFYERAGIPNSGAGDLLLRLPAGAINSAGTPSARVMGAAIPVTPGQSLSYGGMTMWAANVAIPSGLVIQQRIGVQFFDASGAFLQEVYPGDVVNAITSVYARNQAGTVVVPANAATAQLECCGFVTGGSATSTGLCADLRFDDVYLQVGANPIAVTGLVVSEAPSATPQYPVANISWTPGPLTAGARVYLTRSGLPEFLAADSMGNNFVTLSIFEGYTYTVRVVGYDIHDYSAPYATAPTATILAQGAALLPQNVSGFYASACVTTPTPSVTLNWALNPSTDNIDHYEVRFGGTVINPVWANSTPLSPNPAATSSSEVYAGNGPGNYLIMAVNAQGIYSAVASGCTAVVGGSSGGSGGGGYGGGGGGGGCPDELMFVGEELQARDAMVGVQLDCLRGKWVPTAAGGWLASWWNRIRRRIQWRRFGQEECVRLVTANGAALVISVSTPVATQENEGCVVGDPRLWAGGLLPGHHVVTDVGSGLEWSSLIKVEPAGWRRVVRLYVGGRNYAAGEQWGRVIYTHNAFPISGK